jgi:outer membrane protein TolC
MSGCAVGPDFQPAAVPEATGYVPGKLASPGSERGGPRVASQHFVTGEDVSARWWAAFKSRGLNELVRQSVDHNPNLQAAEAAIKIAQYNAQAQRGLFYPQVTGNSTSTNNLIANPGQVPPIPTTGPQSQFTLFTNQLTVSYVPDVWGQRSRRGEPGCDHRAAIVPAGGGLSRADKQCRDGRDSGSLASRPDRGDPAHYCH